MFPPNKLHVESELIYYDQPLCVLLSDYAGQYYIAFFLYDTADYEYWCVSAVGKERLIAILEGKEPLRDAVGNGAVTGRLLTRNEAEYRFTGFKGFASPEYLPDSDFKFSDHEMIEVVSKIKDRPVQP